MIGARRLLSPDEVHGGSHERKHELYSKQISFLGAVRHPYHHEIRSLASRGEWAIGLPFG